MPGPGAKLPEETNQLAIDQAFLHRGYELVPICALYLPVFICEQQPTDVPTSFMPNPSRTNDLICRSECMRSIRAKGQAPALTLLGAVIRALDRVLQCSRFLMICSWRYWWPKFPTTSVG